MQCQQCGNSFEGEAKFCPFCGVSMMNQSSPGGFFCDNCGTKLLSGATFCTGCGKQFGFGVQTQQSGCLKCLDSIRFSVGKKMMAGIKNQGRLCIYPDKLDFSKQSLFLNNQNAINAAQNESFSLPLSNIRQCFYTTYTLGIPSMGIELKNSPDILYFYAVNKRAELMDAITIVHQYMEEASETSVNDSNYSFLMTINNCIPIDDIGSAVIGSVKKGSVKPGDKIRIVSDTDENKGTFEIRGIAVNKIKKEEAKAGDRDTALLIFCSPSYIKAKDKICVMPDN